MQTKTFCKQGVPICNFLGWIPVCKWGVPVCKWGFPVCVLGHLFLEGVIAKWITWAAKPPIFVSHLQVSFPIWQKEYLFLLKENLLYKFLRRNFGKNQVWRRPWMFRVYIGTSRAITQKQTYPRIHLGIAVCIRGSPYDHHMHMGIVQSLTVCIHQKPDFRQS